MRNWDKSLKMLIAECPQAFAELILGMLNIETRGIEILAQLDTEFQGTNLIADALLLTRLPNQEEVLVLTEFQSVADPEMPDRLLDYSSRARKKHKSRPTIASTIYLRDVGKVPEPPHCWSLQSGRKLLAFDYLSIKLHEQEAAKIPAFQHPAMLPLTMLTKGGANRIIVADVFNQLQSNGLKNLLPVTNLLANLALEKNQEDLDWLERKYRAMMGTLKDLPAYHWMTDDALQEGIEKGLEEGLATCRRGIASMIEIGFPGVLKFAQKELSLIRHTSLLEMLMTNIYRAKTPADVKRYLVKAVAESAELDKGGDSRTR